MQDEETVGVTAFKPRSLELIEKVASGGVGRVVLTKRGVPVAAIVPIGAPAKRSIFGAMKGQGAFVPGVDLTEPIDVEWEANR